MSSLIIPAWGQGGGNFSENNVLTDGAVINACLEALDLKWGDLLSNANGEGLSLVGFEDPGTFFQGADPEAAIQEVGAALAGGINGLEVSYTSASTMTIAAGTCRDSTNSVNITLAPPQVIDITAAGANGLDTGAEANSTWYQIIVATGATGTCGLFHAGAGAPTLPAGYDVGYRRIGWVRNHSSGDFLAMRYVGSGCKRYCRYLCDRTTTRVINALAGVAPYNEIDCSAYVPPTVRVADIWCYVVTRTMLLSGDGTTDHENLQIGSLGVFPLPLSATQRIWYYLSAAGGTAYADVRGWEDAL